MQKQIINELKVSNKFSAKKEIIKRIDFLRKFLKKNKFNGFIIGLSGGQDSTLAGKLAQIAVVLEDKKLIGIRMPYGMQRDAIDVDKAIEFIKPSIVQEFNIKMVVDSFCISFKQFNGECLSDFNKGNVKARMRMVVQYAIAAKENMVVIGTDHASEKLMGFFTKYGDGAADIMPLNGLTKFQGREMLKKLNCPNKLYYKKPTADLLDLKPLQSDEEELGISYKVIEKFLQGKMVSNKDFEIIVSQFNKTRHKRTLPVVMEI